MSTIPLPDITILNGSTTSAVVDTGLGFWDLAREIVIVAPASLGAASSVKIYIAKDNHGGTFAPLQSNGADITLAAGKGTPLIVVGFGALKLVADVDPGTNLTFEVSGREEFMGRL